MNGPNHRIASQRSYRVDSVSDEAAHRDDSPHPPIPFLRSQLSQALGSSLET